MARQADAPRALEEVRLEMAELRASRKRLALAAIAERREMERALHDGVQQQLVALINNLELAAGGIESDPAEAHRLLAEIVGDAQEVLEGTRKFLQRLYPPLLESGGLRAALRAAALDADVPIQIDLATGKALPPEISGTVYLCCLDVLERAPARTPVAVTVRDEEDVITFEIVVDGDVDSGRPTSRDRVVALGGRLTIRSGPGHETRVAGSVPLSG